jgi:hypothetical protein
VALHHHNCGEPVTLLEIRHRKSLGVSSEDDPPESARTSFSASSARDARDARVAVTPAFCNVSTMMFATSRPALVSECEDLNPAAQSKVSASADGVGAGLEPVEDLQGALLSGECSSPRHSIKYRAEMFAGFWHAPLLSQ